MGFWDDAWDGLSNAVGNVFGAIGNAANDLAHARVLSAVKNVTAANIGATAPGVSLNTVSGGRLATAIGKVPFVGSIGETNLRSGTAISEGKTSFSNFRDYGVSSAEIGALAYGGAYAVGSAAPLTNSAVLLGAASQAGKGNALGAISAASPLVGGVDLGIGTPGGLKDAYNTVSPYLPSFGGSNPTSGSGTNLTLPGQSSAMPSSGGGFPILPILAVAGGAALYLYARKK